MADDAGILHQSLDVLIGHRGDGDGVELVESAAVIFAFFQYRNP